MLDIENEDGRIYSSFTGHTKLDCVWGRIFEFYFNDIALFQKF